MVKSKCAKGQSFIDEWKHYQQNGTFIKEWIKYSKFDLNNPFFEKLKITSNQFINENDDETDLELSDEAIEAIKESDEDIKAGRVITHEKLKFTVIK